MRKAYKSLCLRSICLRGGGSVQQGLSAAFEVAAYDWHRGAADKRYSLGLRNARMDDAHSPEPRPCLSCELVQGAKLALGGTILETDLFHAHQDFAYPIPGLVILAAKRHFYCMDELSAEEANEFTSLIRRIRSAQRRALAIEHVYYFYNEDTSHHFHLWMVPRYEWMRQFGKSVQAVRPSLLHSRDHMADTANLAEVKRCVEKLRATLAILPAEAYPLGRADPLRQAL